MKPTPEEIRQTQTKERPLTIEPWVAAGLSRIWQSMKKNIIASATASGPAIASDRQVQPHTVQLTPASSHNHS